jgi:hypothetical protein
MISPPTFVCFRQYISNKVVDVCGTLDEYRILRGVYRSPQILKIFADVPLNEI